MNDVNDYEIHIKLVDTPEYHFEGERIPRHTRYRATVTDGPFLDSQIRNEGFYRISIESPAMLEWNDPTNPTRLHSAEEAILALLDYIKESIKCRANARKQNEPQN
jgi:hypothetical protein